MPSDSTKRRKAASDKQAPLSGSDEEILQARAKLEKIDAADSYLGLVGYGLWGLSLFWFLNFSDSATALKSLHAGATEACLVCFTVGGFCRGISTASPRAWSLWRHGFQLAWCPVFGIVAFTAAALAMKGHVGSGASSNACWLLALGCGGGAAGIVLTIPGTSPTSGKATEANLARTLLLVDGGAAIASGVYSLLRVQYQLDLGPITAAATALPLLPWGYAMCLCRTDAEMLTAVPWCIFYYFGAALRSFYIFIRAEPAKEEEGGYFGIGVELTPVLVLFVVHCALYLPILGESNPFNAQLKRAWKAFCKLLTSNVGEGFGEGGD